jgi:hypothetical protein
MYLLFHLFTYMYINILIEGCLFDGFIYSWKYSFTHSCTYSFSHSFIHLSIYVARTSLGCKSLSKTNSFIYNLIQLCSCWTVFVRCIYSVIYFHGCIHSFMYVFICFHLPLIYSYFYRLMYLFLHPCIPSFLCFSVVYSFSWVIYSFIHSFFHLHVYLLIRCKCALLPHYLWT